MEPHRSLRPAPLDFELLVLHLLAVTLAPHHFRAVSPQVLAGLLTQGLGDTSPGALRQGLDARHPRLEMALAFWVEAGLLSREGDRELYCLSVRAWKSARLLIAALCDERVLQVFEEVARRASGCPLFALTEEVWH